MKMILLSAAMLCCEVSIHAEPTAFDRFNCLSQIESGDNDMKVGAYGEIGRFQCTKRVWREYTALPYYAATNGVTALNVAILIMQERSSQFELSHHRQATDFEWCLLWHAPARVDKPSARDRDYATRFCNLRGVK